jgi:hypothetical protein
MPTPKILSIGTSALFHDPEVRRQLSLLGDRDFRWFACTDADEALEHFFLSEPIQLLLVDESVSGLTDLLAEVKETRSSSSCR